MKRRLYYYGEDVLSKSFLILPKELVFTKSLANMSAKWKNLYHLFHRKNSRRSVLQQGNDHAYDGRTRAPWTDRKTEART